MSKAPRETLTRHLLIGLAIAALIYFVSFALIQNWRTRGGPWQLTFASDASGQPFVQIAQPQLKLADVTVTFPDERLQVTNLAQTVVFDRPITNVPFGKVVYFDTTFLPGSIVLDLFGHQLQLLPRVLLVDRREVPWQSTMRLELRMPNQPPKP
jgi:hypothetical protein